MRLSQVGSRISSSSHYVRADRATLGECAETRTRYYTHFGRTPWWGVEFQANFLPGLWFELLGLRYYLVSSRSVTSSQSKSRMSKWEEFSW